MSQHGHAPHGHGHGHAEDLDWSAMVAFAESEGEVLMPFLVEATSLVADLSRRDGLDVRRILDIGSGPGVATCVLAERFASASVVAADGSAEMLANVTSRAAGLGLSDRVTTRLVQLPDEIATLDGADLVWASMVLHHVGDEVGALRQLRSRLGPGGLLALVEFGDPLRVLPEAADLGRPGVWDRLRAAHAAWLADMRAGLPGATPSADYPTMLEAAGFEVLVDRVVEVRLDPPLDERGRRLALDHLRLMREHAAPYADAADLAVLDRLIDEDAEDGIRRRPDVLLHASRHQFVARAVQAG